MKPRHLFLGCGHARMDARTGSTPAAIIDACDCNPACAHPNDAEFTLWDLNEKPWPWLDSKYDVIHAYEVLEHLGTQGDAHAFFQDFSEIWRILKPGGRLQLTVPRWDTVWAWGDPSHTRIINGGSLSFLSQDAYEECGRTTRTDFRYMYKADFKVIEAVQNDTLLFAELEAIK